MLVDEDRNGSPGCAEDVENLAKISTAGVKLLQSVVERIIAVFRDEQNGVDGELARTQGQGIGNGRAKANAVPRSLGPAQVLQGAAVCSI